MMPVPLPNVQKSLNALWPAPSISHSRLGDGAASNAGCVTVANGTIASTEPPMKNDGLSGSGAARSWWWCPRVASLPPRNTPDAIET